MAEEIASKRLKVDRSTPAVIGTHNGHFHADEALAVYLLRLLPTYNPSTLIRTRDPALLSTCHTVVDVGGEYNPASNRYDHHQRTFDTTFPKRATKLSSAGLVYMHFGKSIIAQQTKLQEEAEEVKVLYEKLYTDFVEALDAHDNGISVYDPKDTAHLQKRFQDSSINLGSLVGDLNANFEDTEGKSAEQLQKEEDERFLQASSLMGTVFLRKLEYYHRAWLPARAVVHASYAKRKEIDSNGRIMVLERSVPWKDHLYTLEAEHPQEEKVLYVLYPEGPQEGAKWRIQAVSVAKDSFESRKPLPAAWRGVRDDKLDEVAGIPGCVFTHASGFIGGNKTFDGAKAMAEKALVL
ncbi:putative UPF0160 protein C27H6.8 [Xylona heveae TC161]|uniref:Putative UPF0160 protein C27H6.8 n=1 Tax=Xylona heveae (strain CBS 132557 / TC161) TaxID=1328760 RepID=A0A161THI1_XYLHT|nr:putative UPF0160 protein C27H6.8 [Xylona heveae TC161]KZF25707.1 putative UPF0160 protein C27H6.8 [Xylona heveae TC161]